MQIRGYLIPAADLLQFRSWAEGKNWHGRRMPESPDAHNALLAAHPKDPAWAQVFSESDHWMLQSEQRPCDLFTAAARYAGTGTDRDHSAAPETTGYVPSRRLHNLLGLSRSGDFEWENQQGTSIAKDPSIADGGPSSLLASRQETVERLAEADLTIIWTVLAGKDLYHRDGHLPDTPRWVTASAAYALDNSDVILLYATARSYVGPTEINNQPWSDMLRDRG